MPEIKEVIRRLYMTPREFAERFPEIALVGDRDRVMVEEVYRPADRGDQTADAFFQKGGAEQGGMVLVLRGTRFASGRWLSQTPQPQQAPDAAEEERAPS